PRSHPDGLCRVQPAAGTPTGADTPLRRGRPESVRDAPTGPDRHPPTAAGLPRGCPHPHALRLAARSAVTPKEQTKAILELEFGGAPAVNRRCRERGRPTVAAAIENRPCRSSL